MALLRDLWGADAEGSPVESLPDVHSVVQAALWGTFHCVQRKRSRSRWMAWEADKAHVLAVVGME